MPDYASGAFNKRKMYAGIIDLLQRWRERSGRHYDEICATSDADRSLRLEGSSSQLLHCCDELRVVYNEAKDTDGDLERKVIEAAKALGIIRLLADARDGRDFTTEQCRALRDFEGAVAALQEVEGG